MHTHTDTHGLTLLAGLAKLMLSTSMPLIIAASDCIVLLYTTGRYCLHSSLVNPLSWMILGGKRVPQLKKESESTVDMERGEFSLGTMNKETAV